MSVHRGQKRAGISSMADLETLVGKNVTDSDELAAGLSTKAAPADISAAVSAHAGVSDAHHSRYTNGEADARIAVHAGVSDAHHARYTDGEADARVALGTSPATRRLYLSTDDLADAQGVDVPGNGSIAAGVGYRNFIAPGGGVDCRWQVGVHLAPYRYYTLPDGDFIAWVHLAHYAAQVSTQFAQLMLLCSADLDRWYSATHARDNGNAGYFAARKCNGSSVAEGGYNTHGVTTRWVGVARQGSNLYALDCNNLPANEPDPEDFSIRETQACTPGSGYEAANYDRLAIVGASAVTTTALDLRADSLRIYRI